MRPITISYTPLDDNTTYFKDGATGAGPFTPTTLATTDNLAHVVSLTSTADLHLIDMTLTGTDADGFAQTEVVAGPNNNTVYGTKYFRSLSSVAAASTLGANTMGIGIKDVCVSQTVPINRLQSSFSDTQDVAITGTTNYTVQYTNQELYLASPPVLTWYAHASLTTKTASAASSLTAPFTALRLLINSLTAGATLVFTSIQTRG